MTRLPQASSRLRELSEEMRVIELDRLEREVKFSDDPKIRREATRKFIELTNREFGQ